MLKVRTYVNESTIPGAGMGCFADENIRKGQIIWELDPVHDRIYTEHNLLEAERLVFEFIKTYAYKHNDLYFLCIDNARFFNHSDEPNTVDPCDEYITYAKRDIRKGEEILSDYGTFGGSKSDYEFNMMF